MKHKQLTEVEQVNLATALKELSDENEEFAVIDMDNGHGSLGKRITQSDTKYIIIATGDIGRLGEICAACNLKQALEEYLKVEL